jgi:hypothetical protein
MAALTADKQVKLTTSGMEMTQPLVKASTTIYDGALICLEAADGYARPCAAALTAPEFLGIAAEKVVNGGASGAAHVKTIAETIIEVAAIAGATGVTDIGTQIYTSTDNIADLTTTSTSNVSVGKIIAYVGAQFYVLVQADALRSI